jgi:YHS domain-containing protein
MRGILRAIVWLLLTVLLISFLRGVIGWLARSFSQYSLGGRPAGGPRQAGAAKGGVLHRDPVCGTYVGEGASIALRQGNQAVYFCSEACRDKYAARG